MHNDGPVTVDKDWITVTPASRLPVRNISMVFDRYLQQGTAQVAALPAEAPVQRIRDSTTI